MCPVKIKFLDLFIEFLNFYWFSDLKKLYYSNQMNPNDDDPQFLQNKVQFDIRFYFWHCGNKNIYEFTKDTFSVKTHLQSGLHYLVKQQDEMTKNHSETSNQLVTGTMTETPDHPLCPIKSYLKYVVHLHPRCDSLWQHPKKKEQCTDGCLVLQQESGKQHACWVPVKIVTCCRPEQNLHQPQHLCDSCYIPEEISLFRQPNHVHHWTLISLQPEYVWESLNRWKNLHGNGNELTTEPTTKPCHQSSRTTMPSTSQFTGINPPAIYISWTCPHHIRAWHSSKCSGWFPWRWQRHAELVEW